MIKMTGFAEIDRVIKQLPHQLTHPLLQQIHYRAVQPYVKAAYFAAPLRTGRTAESIGVIRRARSRGTLGLIEAGPRRGGRYKGHYAHFSEFGTKKREYKGANRGRMPRKPFLEPAWDRTSQQVLGGIREATGRVIYNFMRRTIKKYG